MEEAGELREAPPGSALEEAADVYEVLTTVAAHEGWSLQEVAARAADKRRSRGGFEDGLFLESYSRGRGYPGP